MASVWRELKRRNVFKVGAAYAIVAWLLLQIADVVLPTFEAPAWVMQVFTFFMILGFPIALLLAWAYEMTPEGIRAASKVGPTQSITHATGLMLNYFIVGLLVVAVGFLVVDQYVLEPGANRAAATISSTETLAEPGAPQVLRSTITLEATEPVGAGLSAHLTVSPDGRQLVYAARVGGEARLYRRQLDQFESHLIPGTEGAHHPFFSPDGEWVAFYTDTDSTDSYLKTVPLQGGAVLNLVETRFSGGGSWVVDDTIIYGTADDVLRRHLYRVPANGGTPERLMTADAERGYATPVVLPGGDAVLFAIRPGPGGNGIARNGHIAVLSLENGEVRTLIDEAYRPRYAPTGHILFVRGGDLWAVPFDLEGLEPTGVEVPVVQGVQQQGDNFGEAAYAFSDNGILVYVAGASAPITAPYTELVWVDRQGNEELLTLDSQAYANPRLSPDDQKLAVSVLDGDNTDIWIYDLIRNVPSRLTFLPGVDDGPIWTQDGEHIVFRSRREGAGLYRKAADGTGPVTLLHTSFGNNVFPGSFSPDGTELVFRRPGQRSDVHVLSLTGEPASRPLLQTEFADNNPRLSPDGRWLAYDSDESGEFEIYVRPFPNIEGGRWQISMGGGREPLWGPDSNELFYRGREGVMVVSAETEPTFSPGSPRVLFPDTYAVVQRPSYDVSSDGQRFLMLKLSAEQPERDSAPIQLRIVNNWFQELERLAPPSQ